ncbi:MAG: NAD-dependent deacylase [Thermoplasmata archaeon]|nr:MAG: NAD-dependent deacylase [Thermoplasmata archaeon]
MNTETHLNNQDELIKRTAKAIIVSENTIALTGAGISVASGIPPFRGKGGLWEKYNPDEYAHVAAFLEDPKKVWIMLKEMIDTILPAKPNPAHIALFELEEMGLLSGIITGNVDSLHQAAGSKNVWELHGSNRTLICMKCNKTYPIERYQIEIPPRCECGFALRPDVVLFGEQLSQEVLFGSYALARECELMLVVGTSSVVSPMSHMPVMAGENGAKVLEINLEETFLTGLISDWIIKGKVEDILPNIVKEVKKL